MSQCQTGQSILLLNFFITSSVQSTLASCCLISLHRLSEHIDDLDRQIDHQSEIERERESYSYKSKHNLMSTLSTLSTGIKF